MAERESTVSALELAQKAVELADTAYEMGLELSTLLDALGEPNDSPKWVFPLHRMASRVTLAADLAHTAALHVRASLEGGVQ